MQEYVELAVGDLEPHPLNPRRGDVEAIQESIEVNGFFGAVIAQTPRGRKKRHRIIAGEHRWRAAKEQGMTDVPVLALDVDDATAIRMMVADNRTSDQAGYALRELADVLSNMESLVGTGYSVPQLADLQNQRARPDLDDLLKQPGGDDDDDDAWSRRIDVEVPLAEFGLWTAYVANVHGGDGTAAFVAMIKAVT